MARRIGSATIGAIAAMTLCFGACVTPRGAKAPPAQAEEIRLGIVVPLTGAVPSFGVGVRNGALLAIQEWNAKGGICGRRIATFVEDGRCTQSAAVDAARRLIAANRVSYLIGDVCSVASIPISEIANAAKVVQITPTSTNPRVTIDASGHVKRYIFRNCFVDPYQGVIGAKFAYHHMGARTAFTMGDTGNEYVSSLRSTFEAAFTNLGGAIVGSRDYSRNQTDYADILSQIEALHPDIVWLPDYYDIVNVVARQARARGIVAPFFGGDGWDSTELDLEATEGSYFINHFSDQDLRPEVVRFIDAYERTYPNDTGALGDRHMLSALSYDAANMLFEAIKTAGGDDTGRVATALESMRYHGVTGDLSFDSSHNPLKSAYIYAIRDHRLRFAVRIDP